jgi:molecular chaperone GrpE
MSNEEKPNEEIHNEENVPASEEHQQNDNPENQEHEDFEAMFREMNERYLRLYSEFDNFRKRTAREKADMVKTAGSDVIKAVLPVLDDFERAIKANETLEDIVRVKEGFSLIHHKMNLLLQARGLKQMDILGKDFNPDLSEAIANVPVEDESKKGKVIDVVENGYYLNDLVIRYAKVVVGQ